MNQKATRTRAVVDRAYTQLKEMILYHKVKPGQRMHDRDLAQELGVSRTPVREALSRLEGDGLVVNLKGRGYIVRELSPKEVEYLYDLRELIECHAMGLAVKHAQSEDIEELAKVLDAIKALDGLPEGRSEAVKLGIQVHEIVGRASGNPFLHEMMIRLLNQLLFCIWTEAWLEAPAEVHATNREHRAYLAALRAKSAKKARAIVRTHVRRAKSQFLRMLKSREAFYGHSGKPLARGAGRGKAHREGRSRPISRDDRSPRDPGGRRID